MNTANKSSKTTATIDNVMYRASVVSRCFGVTIVAEVAGKVTVVVDSVVVVVVGNAVVGVA